MYANYSEHERNKSADILIFNNYQNPSILPRQNKSDPNKRPNDVMSLNKGNFYPINNN